jgi:6-pyruvoyltetrahydropterin/6-carboxytetrahydropterin synthase
METTIATEYEFCSAHSLPKVPDTHKCKRVHGHNYKLVVKVRGVPDAKLGMIMDFFDLDAIVKPLVEQVDHRYLNDIPGLDNPTAELIAQWFWKRIKSQMPVSVNISEVLVRVYETPTCYAEV